MISALRVGVTQVHRWVGLTAGLLGVYLAVTGGWIVLRPVLDPVTYPKLMVIPPCTTPLPVDTIAKAARTYHHRGRVDYVWFYGSPTSSTMVRFSDSDQVYVNGCTGKVLGDQQRYGGLYGTVEWLHRFMFAEHGIAMLIIGTVSLLMSVMLVLGGVFLWWPRRKSAWKSAVKLNPRLRGRAFSLNLHTTTGVYASIVLFIVALTAVPLSFSWARAALFAMTHTTDPVLEGKSAVAAAKGNANSSGRVKVAKKISMEKAWEEARALVPGPLLWASLRIPAKRGTIQVQLVQQGAPHSDARSYVDINSATGKVLNFRPYATLNAGSKLSLWVQALHTGHFGGVPVQVLMLFGMIGTAVLGYTGVESFVRKRFRRPKHALAPAALTVRVAKIRDESPDIRSFVLVSANGASLPPVSAGAHIDVRLGNGLVRQYSLTNGPQDTDGYHIAVRLAPDGRGGSVAMHALREGDTLMISAPRNHFPLQDHAEHHLLLAGGIGITPLLSMARHVNEMGGSFQLHYFTRSPEVTAFNDALSEAGFIGKVCFHYAYDAEQVQRFLQDLLRLRPAGTHLYVCGPTRFMSVVHEAAGAAWPAETVHCEYFAGDPNADAGPRDAFEVTLARSGETFVVSPEVSILQLLSEVGIDVPSSCEQGVCGTCLTRVLEGEPDHRDVFLTAAERACGDKMLVCVSRAKGERLVLDV